MLLSAERSLLKLLTRGRRGIAAGLAGRGWQHHREQEKVQGEQFMKRMVAGTLSEGMAGEKPGVNDGGELMLEREGSPHERNGLPEVRDQNLSFFGNSEVDLVGAVTTQSCHGTANSIGLSGYRSQLKSRRQVGADSSPLPAIATPVPWVMLL